MLRTEDKITVVIPVYNGAATLRACLEALLFQTRPADELIIVDNASTDQTKEIVENFSSRFPNLRYVFEDNRGRGQARSTGLLAASGQIIAMTDADCIVPTDWLKKLVQPIEAGNENIVMGFESDGVKNYWSQHRQAAELKFFMSRTKAGYINFLDTKNFAGRADLLKKIGFNPRLSACEDLDFFLRLKKAGYAVRFLPEICVEHRHVTSWWRLAVTQFTYGRHTGAIVLSYRGEPTLREYLPEPENSHLSPGRKFLSLLVWSLDEILHRPQDAPYKLIDEWAWKIGTFSVRIKKINLD